MRYQQNLATLGVALIVLIAPSNRLADLLPLVPGVHAALTTVRAGDIIEISN